MEGWPVSDGVRLWTAGELTSLTEVLSKWDTSTKDWAEPRERKALTEDCNDR